MSERRAPIDLLINTLYAGAFVLLVYGLLAWLIERPMFALHHLDIRGDLKHVDEAQIRLVASRDLRGNFFTIDLDKVRSEFEKLPWVNEVRATRQWPDRLQVTLVEHVPLAVWNGQQLVSTEGKVFNAHVENRLPHFYGVDGSGAEMSSYYRKFSAALAPLGVSIQTLSLSPRKAWRLITDSGLEVALGRTDGELRLQRFVSVYSQVVARLGAAPIYADLRYADGFALKRPQAVTANL